MEQNEIKTGHPVLGAILGILGIGASFPASMLFGVIGGGVCALLGIIAIILGVKAKRGGRKGVPAVVFGVIAIVLAVLMTVMVVVGIAGMQKKAAESGTAPLLAKYAENPYFGVVGILNKIPKDEGAFEDLMEELNQFDSLGTDTLPANAD